MIGLFCGVKVKSDEEYRAILRKRIMLLGIIFLIGIISLLIPTIAKNILGIYNVEGEYYYYGFGSGLIFASLVLILKTINILKNPSKLKSERIKNGDERNKNISLKSARIALGILALAMTLIIITSGITNPEIRMIMGKLLLLLLLSYTISYRILNSKE
ncbi:hypothetical protein [Miniphocaeibacter halophilus]|uniref:Uncharacterized protein n=1 Tax=Miniphocaeibacter halophilus TaxID=2931922 RepID=A0AC61MPV0_9FIRM|nr:hypothetical protein [Miniphocaeibacter halophilus]QQK06884.1 hypothetical protein JFY71_05915 [Miniphocaeibacter halophilus]